MKRFFTLAIMATMLCTIFVPAQSVSAQGMSGDALCQQAINEAGTGQGQFGRYTLVNAPAQGGSGSQVVVGTDGDDVLVGGSGSDILCGFGGDDILLGGSGNDILVGGPGSDQLFGESGGDTLIFDDADSRVEGGTGNNQTIEDASAPADPPSLTAVIGPPAPGTGCTVTLSLSGAMEGAEVFLVIIFDISTGTGIGDERIVDSSGSAETVFFLSQGVVVVEARAEDNDGQVLASISDVGTCGG